MPCDTPPRPDRDQQRHPIFPLWRQLLGRRSRWSNHAPVTVLAGRIAW